MLVDVSFHNGGGPLGAVLRVIGGARGGPIPIRIDRGFYVSSHWSFEHVAAARIIRGFNDESIWEDLRGLGIEHGYTGVCDSTEQFIARFKEALDAHPRNWCVSFVVLHKAYEPVMGGWRWHKWGPYIGEKSPQHEYLAHEGPEITQAVTFHVYALSP